MNSKSIAQLTALIMAHGLAGAGGAQSTNAPPADAGSTNSTTKLPDVLVTGQQASPYKPAAVASPKYSEPLRDIPQTITVIPQAVIREQGATTLRDVLRNVTGISMQAGEGGGGLPGDNLSIRGFNARNDIYVDGVRDYGAYSRDPFNIEQVEVTKGPASSYGGRGTAGGSINLVSKSPSLDPFYGGTLGFGTDDYKRVTVDVNQPLTGGNPQDNHWIENSALRLNAMWHDADAPGRDVVTYNRWAVAPSLEVGLGTPTRVTLSYVHMIQDNVPEYGIPWVTANNTNAVLAPYQNAAPPVSFDNFYGLKDYDFEDIENDVATASVEHDFTSSLTLRNLSRWGRTDRISAITSPRFADLNPGALIQESTVVNRQLQRRDIENEIFANQTDFTAKFDTGPVGHAVVAGFEYTRELQNNGNSAQTTNQPQTDIFFPNPYQQPLGPMPPNFGIPSKGEADTVAPYFFETLTLGEQWEVSGGVRWDHVDADYSTGGTNFGRTDDLLSWRAGLVFKPRPNGSIYFGCGTSFNPSIDGNVGMVLSGTTNNANNVNLDPEETRSFELGTKWDFIEERLLLSAAVFRTEKINARTQTTANDVVALDGEQIVQGVEFGVAGSLTKEWRVFAGYAYMESEIKQSNNASEVGAEFGNTPEHSASLWTTYDLPFGLQVGGGAQYVGERFNGQSNGATVRRAPDYFVFDAVAAYRVNKNFTLRLNVYNLADERYIDRLGGGHFVPGAGRSATLTAEVTF